jgi:L-iditol 2-dehydrogenase
MKRMLAAVYRAGSGVSVEEAPLPPFGSSEILLRLNNASICGTDIRIIKGAHRKLDASSVRIPGHEIVGTIEATGSDVTGLHAGQKVFLAPNMGCGQCVFCRSRKNNLCPDSDAFGITLDGGFAEFMRVTAPAIEQGNVMPLEDDVDLTTATLTEPFACVLRGQEAVRASVGDVVLILGAGPIGLMHALLAAARGVKRIMIGGRSAARLALATTISAARVIDMSRDDLTAAVLEETGGTGADVIIVAAPSAELQQQALKFAAPAGRINLFAGLPKDNSSALLDTNLIHYKELLVTGTTACSTSDCRQSLDLIVSGKVDLSVLVTARFPLERALDAFAAAQDPANLKVVLDMNGRHRP